MASLASGGLVSLAVVPPDSCNLMRSLGCFVMGCYGIFGTGNDSSDVHGQYFKLLWDDSRICFQGRWTEVVTCCWRSSTCHNQCTLVANKQQVSERPSLTVQMSHFPTPPKGLKKTSHKSITSTELELVHMKAQAFLVDHQMLLQPKQPLAQTSLKSLEVIWIETCAKQIKTIYGAHFIN